VSSWSCIKLTANHSKGHFLLTLEYIIIIIIINGSRDTLAQDILWPNYGAEMSGVFAKVPNSTIWHQCWSVLEPNFRSVRSPYYALICLVYVLYVVVPCANLYLGVVWFASSQVLVNSTLKVIHNILMMPGKWSLIKTKKKYRIVFIWGKMCWFVVCCSHSIIGFW